MKYKIGDRVEYNNDGDIGIGTITLLERNENHHNNCDLCYVIDEYFFCESKEIAKKCLSIYYIIKKINKENTMKYKIDDLVEYYNDGKIGQGAITRVLPLFNSPYFIDNIGGYYESEEKEKKGEEGYCKSSKDKGKYIIKEIEVKKEEDYYVGDIVKHQFKDGAGRTVYDIGTIIKIILRTDNIDIYRIRSWYKNDILEFRDVTKDYIIKKVQMEEGVKIKEEKHPGGRPLKFKTVEELQDKIEEYKKWVVDYEKPLTIERLACFLGCDRVTLLNYEKLEERKEFFNTIKEIKSFILADKSERLNSPEGNKAGVIFDLKNNHGFKDKSETEYSTPEGKPFQIEGKNLSEKEIDARILELTLKFNLK